MFSSYKSSRSVLMYLSELYMLMIFMSPRLLLGGDGFAWARKKTSLCFLKKGEDSVISLSPSCHHPYFPDIFHFCVCALGVKGKKVGKSHSGRMEDTYIVKATCKGQHVLNLLLMVPHVLWLEMNLSEFLGLGMSFHGS